MRTIAVLFISVCLASLSFGQGTFKNNGTLANTSNMTVPNFNNFNTSAGVLYNSGTLHVTSNFTNSDATHNGHTYNFNQAASSGGTLSVDGNYVNSAGFTYNSLATSLINVGGTLSNTTQNNFSTDTGTVDFSGASTQTILSNVKGNEYGALKATGGAFAKTLDGNVMVPGVVTVDNGATLGVGGYKLTVENTAPFSIVSGSVDASTVANSEVDYAAPNTTVQAVLGMSYRKLTVSNGTGTRTVASGNTTVSTALKNNSSTSLDFGGGSVDLSTAAITNPSNATLLAQGNVTIATGDTVGGTFDYNGAGQTIGAAEYHNLTLAGSGTKTFTNGETYSVSNTYVAGGDSRTYGTSTFRYNGGAQSVTGGESYGNLVLLNTDTTVALYKTATGSVTATGSFTQLRNVLDMGSNTLSYGTANQSDSSRVRFSGAGKAIGSGIVEYYGATAANIENSATYKMLWITGTNKTVSANVATSFTGGTALYIGSAGSLTVDPTFQLTITGDAENDGVLTNNGTITVN